MTCSQNKTRRTRTHGGMRPLVAASVLALVFGIAAPQPALAFDCLLDTNNDGNADTNVDTDSFADSNGSFARLACGKQRHRRAEFHRCR